NTVDARDSDEGAMLVYRNDCFGVRIQLSDFGGIDCAVSALRDFNQSQRGARIHHSRINVQATCIDRLRAGRNIHRCSYCFNLSVADNYGSIIDISATNSNDMSIPDGINSARRSHTLLHSRITNLLCLDIPKAKESCDDSYRVL